MNPKLAILCAAALAMASCGKGHKAAPVEETPEVDVASVVVDSITLSKTYPGTLQSQKQVDVVGRVNGTLLTQNYVDGDHVRKGQVLFTIEDTQYRDAVTQAKSALDNARSTLEYARKNYEATQKAYESDAVAQIQLLQTKNAYEQAQASVANCEAALQSAQTNLRYCTVTAPFDGTASKGQYTPGSYIGGAAAPVTLATIYDNDELYAVFYIEDNAFIRAFENHNNRDQIDYDKVPIEFSESLPHSYTGKLSYFSPEVDTSTGTLMLRLSVDSPYGELRDGMYCNIVLPYKFEPRAVMVLDAAISTSQTNKFLYTVDDQNRVVYTPIEVGEMANDSMRIVTSGLTGNEKYVTKALLKVRPGMEIKPIATK